MVTVVPTASDSLNTLLPGGIFRQYQLLEQIGVGGQAVVWSALDRAANCIDAIKFNKILDADLTNAEEIGIEQKMERLVGLQHAHILPLKEYGSEERVRFMVSPYIPGGTLAIKIKTSPLSFDRVLQLGTEIASALDYLHSQGVIHRDLKSSNILLDLSGHTYLADFGLARLLSSSTLAFHTGHGTPPYAPPEQILSQEITLKSDIYSFGILLFEMLTGQLPWNGQRQLGVEQLHSDQQLPDPCEYVTGLPPLITEVLRRVTTADPDLRPRSAGEVMRMVRYVFNVSEESRQMAVPYDELAARNRDAEEILRHGLDQWEVSDGAYSVGLTKFALIDLVGKKIDTDNFSRFMLSQSLTYGHSDKKWWTAVRNPHERLLVSSQLLQRDNEVIASRVLKRLTGDSDLLASSHGIPAGIARSLLSIGLKTKDQILRQNILMGLRLLVRAEDAWKDPALEPEQIRRLGELALEESRSGDLAAQLIGHLRSPSAVRVVLREPDEGRKVDTLLLVQKEAGSLPAFVPGAVRARLSLEWVLQRSIQQPVRLMVAYLLAFLGSAAGIGLQVYLTIQLPNFLDTARLAASLERGLIIGAIFGLGIFLARLITERFATANAFPRIILGTLAGGLVTNIAFLLFHVLFLNTPPRSFLITLGCFVMALSFALAGVVRSRFVKITLTSSAAFIAIVGTWLVHRNLAASLLDLTPLFHYNRDWSLVQVMLVALGVALCIGVPGNLIRLSIRGEYR
ncbi:MAG TPA: protein kinase [Anaerolineales bacterium]|nr:protein kinase [Anaerolineales bacterium]